MESADGTFKSEWLAHGHHSAAWAHRLIGYLNDPVFGSRVLCIGVQYKVNDPFGTALQGVTLHDGRRAARVIQSWAGHGTHAHWRITDSLDPPGTTCSNQPSD
jgi:hypothetical protein